MRGSSNLEPIASVYVPYIGGIWRLAQPFVCTITIEAAPSLAVFKGRGTSKVRYGSC